VTNAKDRTHRQQKRLALLILIAVSIFLPVLPAAANTPPQAGAIAPINGSCRVGEETAFATTCIDPDGADNIWYIADNIWYIGTCFTASDNNAVILYYLHNTRQIKICTRTDGINTWHGPYSARTPLTIDENPYITLLWDPGAVQVQADTFTVNWKVKFREGFGGMQCRLHLYARDITNEASGWKYKGADTTAPMLFDPGAYPQRADEFGNITYSIYYYDPKGDPPTRADIIIDSTPYNMMLFSEEPSNGLYSYTTGLTFSDIHEYSFAFEGRGEAGYVTSPSFGSFNGPIVHPSSGTPDLVIDDFEDGEPNYNSLGFWTDDDSTCAVDTDEDGMHRISWDNRGDYWYTTLWDTVTPLNGAYYNKLSFNIRGETGGESFTIELQDINKHRSVSSQEYLTVTDELQEIAVPLDDFLFQGTEPRDLKAAALIFTDSSSGTIYVDDIELSYDAALSVYTPPKFATVKLRSRGPVRLIGRNLFLNDEPFLIKGVGYQPVPIGETHETYDKDDAAIYQRDFPLLKDMGCNTIKIWGEVTTALLDTAQANDIKVCAGYYVDYWLDLSDPAVQEQLLDGFSEYVTAHKDHPALLMWIVGNDQNRHNGDNTHWYGLVDEMAEAALKIEGENYHPVVAGNAGLDNVGFAPKEADDAHQGFLDVWGLNVYKGRTFGDLFHDVAERTSKPVLITEYGADAYNNIIQAEDQASQAAWDRDLWGDIVAAAECIGGLVMSYSDEWWKAGDPDTHDTGGFEGSQPDGFSNEEWYGLVSLQDNGESPDIVIPREAYAELGGRFKETTRGFLDIELPDAPSGLEASVLQDSVTLTWSESPTADIAGYAVYRGSPEEGYVRISEVTAGTLTYEDTGLAAGAYSYVVTAFDASAVALESEPSKAAGAAVDEPTVLSIILDTDTWPIGDAEAGTCLINNSNKITLRNNGNVRISCSLQTVDATNPPVWNAAGTVDGNEKNKYVMSGIFTGTDTTSVDETYFNESGSEDIVLEGNSQTSTDARFATTHSDQNGINIAPDEERMLWLKLDAPRVDTTRKAHDIWVTIEVMAAE